MDEEIKVDRNRDESLSEIAGNFSSSSNSNYAALELTNTQVSVYLQTIHKYVNEHHPEKVEDFTLEKFCRQVQIPKSHFSYLLKYHFKETFVEYRTRLRVELACQLLKESKNRVLTLEAIGENVGFSSRFTFLRAFKKVKGITPSEFLGEFSE